MGLKTRRDFGRAVPILGPALAQAQSQANAGNISGMAGTLAGTVAGFAAPEAAKGIVGGVAKIMPKVAAAIDATGDLAQSQAAKIVNRATRTLKVDSSVGRILNGELAGAGGVASSMSDLAHEGEASKPLPASRCARRTRLPVQPGAASN